MADKQGSNGDDNEANQIVRIYMDTLEKQEEKTYTPSSPMKDPCCSIKGPEYPSLNSAIR